MAKHMRSLRDNKREKRNRQRKKEEIKSIKENRYSYENKYNENKRKNKSKQTKKYNKLLLVFRIISLIVMIICVYQLINWYFENKKNNEILNDMVSNYIQSTKQIIIGEETISVLEANFKDLLEKNSDTVRMAYRKINKY